MSRPLSWREHTGLRAVDIALADTLRRCDRAAGIEPDERVLLAASLASLAIAQGHAAFDPAQPGLLLDDAGEMPDAGAWCDVLQASRWVATPDRDTVADPTAPLVFEDGLLYLRRYREYERRLAQGLRRIAAQSIVASDRTHLAPLFAALFPDARTGDQQAVAAALALQQSLLLITGGPGTGKTATIARLLLLLLAQAQSAGHAPPRIALAAPTGRAAERMVQSLRNAATQLHGAGIDAALCEALPTDASTLHRLLGTIIDSPRFRHDTDNPLPFEVIVVDEASMVDLPLMCKLVEAVPVGAHLILLGDRDQLPSVEAGDVLAAIVDAAGDDDMLPADMAVALWPLQGERQMPLFRDDRTVVRVQARGLTGHRVQLHRGYRQSDALDLAPLAAAMRDGNGDRALALLRDDGLRGVHFHDGLLDPLAGAAREALLAPWRALADVADPASALEFANRMRLLTALREGPQGAHALNARIEEALAGTQRAPYFHGRLLLITENSYRHGLFNGDIGVCLRDDDGVTVAWFTGSDGPRAFHPAALPAHTGAFAMTVHKAQGSEFDQVWLQLPRHDARTLSRELLYTAITRARSTLHVCASESVLRAALTRHAVRVSGLAARLACE